MEAITEVITFEQLLASFPRLSADVQEIKRMLQQKNEPQQPTDTWFNLDGICNYLPEKPAPPTVYGWVAKKEIPNHKRAKKLYFLKSEIDAWLKAGRRKTTSELQSEADSYLHIKGKRG